MTRDAVAQLDRESYISFATFRKTGAAVETPVWFAPSGGRLYLFSESKAGKMKRLANDPTCRIAACDIRGKVHGPWIAGRARRVDDAESVSVAYRALLAKYGWMMRMTDFFSRLTGRYDARAIVEIELTPTAGS
jgi:PPOX class probable F420-dependent enzyme